MSNDEYQHQSEQDKPIIVYYSAFHKLFFSDKESYERYKSDTKLHNNLMYELEYKLMFTNNEIKEN